MPAPELIHVLRSRLCTRLTVQEAGHIAEATVARTIPAGGEISHEGDASSGLIFLVRGIADVVKGASHAAGAQTVATVEGPVMLGEVGLLTGETSSATLRARTACECYLLTRSQFQRLLESDSLAIYKLVSAIAEVLARRLTAMNEKIIARADG